MNKNFNGWIITGSVAAVLMIFAALSEYTYVAALKEQIALTQAQVNDKNTEISNKNTTISTLETGKTEFERKVNELSGSVQAKSTELNQKLAQVRKLQGSIKTVSGCLVGTMGIIEAIKQNDEELARKSAVLAEVTCEESGKIIKDIEKFPSDTQTAQY
jgi:chromosome segregation ATPase